jgi:SSS family solute:Na+ symporter
VGIVIAVAIGYFLKDDAYIIPRGTSIFFGLCASAFLPTFIGALFFRRMTRAGAISSMVTGFAVTGFWLLFVKAKEAGNIGLVMKLTDGKPSILAGHPNWPNVDPLFVALPLSIIAAIVVSLLTQPMDEAHLGRCFPKRRA